MNALSLSSGLLALLIVSQIGHADPLDTWTWRNPSPTGNSLSGVAYGSGQFVAVGYGYAALSNAVGSVARCSMVNRKRRSPKHWSPRLGTILTSADGVNWVQRQSGMQYSVSSIIYGNGQFVAAGAEDIGLDASYGTILTSSDGVNWAVTKPGGSGGFNAIAYANGQFVGVGGEDPYGFITTSADGTNWVFRVTPSTKKIQPLAGVAYGNNRFVAVGGTTPTAYSSNFIATSTDGVNWEFLSSGLYLTAVAYGNGQFVAVGDGGTVITSADGLHWLHRQLGVGSLYGITYGNGRFVAVGDGGAIATSTDGANWLRHQSGTETWLRGIAYGNGHFLAVGDDGAILQSGSIITLAVTPNARTGLLSLSLEGPTSLGYTIQTSTDLKSWLTLTNLASVQSSTVILDALPAARDRVFYRAYSQ